MDRRSVLSGSTAVLAGLAVSSSASAKASGADKGWTKEVDVIVVGTGAAGCAAAIAATLAGASVLVLEKMSAMGGTTAKSGGVAWIPNNKWLRGPASRDEKPDCLKFMARFSYPTQYAASAPRFGLSADRYAMLEAFYDHGASAVDMLAETGALKLKPFELNGVRLPDYADHLPENRQPRGRALCPDDGTPEMGRGYEMIDQLSSWLKRHNVPVMLDTRATEIIMADGRAAGLSVETHNGQERIAARKGIVFATGGYAQKPELVERYQPALWASCAAAGATGDFLAIAGKAGARMGALGTAWRNQVVLEEAINNRLLGQCVDLPPGDSMLFLNKYGKRVCNEKRNYNDRTNIHFVFDAVKEEYPNDILFMVFDERTRQQYAGCHPIPGIGASDSPMVKAASLDELAAKIGHYLSGLRAHVGTFALGDSFTANARLEIERFNQLAKRGEDTDFGRGAQAYDREWDQLFYEMQRGERMPANGTPNPTMHPLANDGNYYAVLLAPGALDTSDGPSIDSQARVLAADGMPLPGLFGAGNCIASPTGRAYYGAGATLGLALTFGVLAGKGAAGANA